MDSTGPRRRWSIDLPPDLGLTFRMQFSQFKDRMKRLVDELQKSPAEVEEVKTGAPGEDVVTAVGAVAGEGAGGEGLFTGSSPLGVFDVHAIKLASSVVDYTMEAKQSTKDFMMITELLKRELRRLEAECRELRRSGPSSTLEKLENSINQLFVVSTDLREPEASDEVEAAAAQCLKVYEGFVEVESELP